MLKSSLHSRDRMVNPTLSVNGRRGYDVGVLSVVIPAYNEEKLVRATLEAIHAACAEINECEVIVVDNESTDRTAEIAASSGAKVITESIHSIARVRNRGAEEALGDVIVFIDADTIIRPTHEISGARRRNRPHDKIQLTSGSVVMAKYVGFEMKK